MITFKISSLDYKAGEAEFAFKGLSTDTKPTIEHAGYAIANGSSFFNIDTQELNFYDKDTEDWV